VRHKTPFQASEVVVRVGVGHDLGLFKEPFDCNAFDVSCSPCLWNAKTDAGVNMGVRRMLARGRMRQGLATVYRGSIGMALNVELPEVQAFLPAETYLNESDAVQFFRVGNFIQAEIEK
jgi:hypothetical protein